MEIVKKNVKSLNLPSKQEIIDTLKLRPEDIWNVEIVYSHSTNNKHYFRVFAFGKQVYDLELRVDNGKNRRSIELITSFDNRIGLALNYASPYSIFASYNDKIGEDMLYLNYPLKKSAQDYLKGDQPNQVLYLDQKWKICRRGQSLQISNLSKRESFSYEFKQNIYHNVNREVFCAYSKSGHDLLYLNLRSGRCVFSEVSPCIHQSILCGVSRETSRDTLYVAEYSGEIHYVDVSEAEIKTYLIQKNPEIVTYFDCAHVPLNKVAGDMNHFHGSSVIFFDGVWGRDPERSANGEEEDLDVRVNTQRIHGKEIWELNVKKITLEEAIKMSENV